MKKIITMCMVLMLVSVLLTGVTAAALAAEGDELPTVTAPPATEAPEEPMLTAMPDKPLTPEDADATDTPENTDPADELEDEGVVSGIDPGDVGTCTAITIICFLVGMAVKESSLDNKWIPIIVGAAGGVIGVAGLYLMPNFPAGDVITAIGVGVLSGLAAVGIHQIGKQLRS